MTPKQRVLKRWPSAFSFLYRFGWVIQAHRRFAIYELGTGPTPAAAWRNAAERMK